MSGIIQWVKANLLIVISSALILILLPVGYIFSNGWNSSIKEEATQAYNDEKRRLSSASNIEYSLPAVLQGEQSISESRSPNAIVTRFYKEQKAIREVQVADVVNRGTAFNQADHAVPVDGLLPDAGSDSELRKKGFRLGELVAGTPETPSLYTRLLRKLNAGDAPDAEALGASLAQFKKQKQDEYAATSPDGRISQTQSDQLDMDLVKRRLGEYGGRAQSIAFYCPLDAIQAEKPIDGFSHIPAVLPGYDSITSSAVYTWVWDYWVVSDVLSAVSLANTDPSGISLSVPDAPVKHVLSVNVSEFVVADGDADADPDNFGGSSRGGRNSASGSSSNDDDASVVKSYTNRGGADQPSDSYDIRYVDMKIIASSKDLPVFFEALAKTNYMTVIDMEIEQVDVPGSLTKGYYYGDDHVVQANLKIETVWLRSWTKEFMPEAVRTALGIRSDNPDDSDG
ncbi:MAG: hypothetical protein AB8C13_07215 [Phycisphaerales bacterium]